MVALKVQSLLVREDAFLSFDSCLHTSMLTLGSTSRVMFVPFRVFRKMCIPLLRHGSRCRVDSWIL